MSSQDLFVRSWLGLALSCLTNPTGFLSNQVPVDGIVQQLYFLLLRSGKKKKRHLEVNERKEVHN